MTERAADRRRRAQVAALEEQARRRPAAYRRRVAAMALFGYAVLGATAAVALGLPALAVVGLANGGWTAEPADAVGLLLMAGLGAMTARALWVPVAPPRGYRLRAEDAPELAAEIDRLRREAGAPPLDGVVLDAELNAAAASAPRAFGLLGERRYLVLGLPLLHLLGRDEVLAIVAHEFGHFRSENGRFMAWIYRLRLRWLRMAALRGSGGPLARFLAWYAPRFDAASFVLAREEEYAADAVACRLVGPAPLASGLIRLAQASDWLDKRLWRTMPARMRARPAPPLSICTEQRRWLGECPPPDLARTLAAGERTHDAHDTHPALSRRLAAAGGLDAMPPAGAPAAALIDPRVLAEAERAVDEEWRARIARPWAEAYAAAEPERSRLDALERRVAASPAEPRAAAHGEARIDAQVDVQSDAQADARADARAWAHLVESLRPEQDPLRAYAAVLARYPDDASLLFRAGALRVDDGDLAGVAQLERAMRLDPGAIVPVFERLDDWDRDASLSAEMAAALAQLRAAYAEQAASLRARDGVDEDDALDPHGLDAEAVTMLGDALARVPPVAEAWLVRKRLALADAPAHYVLLVRWRGSVAAETAGLKRLAAALRLPGSLTVLGDGDSSQRAYARRVRTVAGAAFYRRG